MPYLNQVGNLPQIVSTSIGDMIIEVYKQERSNLIKIKKIFDLK